VNSILTQHFFNTLKASKPSTIQSSEPENSQSTMPVAFCECAVMIV
jgi:hypothetical protein